MKNIHLLPMDKPRRLVKFEDETYLLLGSLPSIKGQGYNIYITNDGEIKKGDYFYSPFQGEERILKHNKFVIPFSKDKKIILTDNKDLIKDGVQAIDDDFLEWFVKNPSCEFVNLENHVLEVGYNLYKIIIPQDFGKPKEEPKQVRCYDKFNQLLKESDYVDVQRDGVHLIYKKEDGELYFKPYGEEDKVSAYFSNDIAKCDADGNWINNDRYEDIEPKQETLEESLNSELKLVHDVVRNKDFDLGFQTGGIFGAKWQADRMYSEEEVFRLTLDALDLGMRIRQDQLFGHTQKSGKELYEEWFDEHKKK